MFLLTGAGTVAVTMRGEYCGVINMPEVRRDMVNVNSPYHPGDAAQPTDRAVAGS